MNKNTNLAVLGRKTRLDMYDLLSRPIIAPWTISSARAKELAKMDYREYLNTAEWSEIRKFMHDVVDHCAGCGSALDLQVHHSNYPKRGAEIQSDLTVLCGCCHAKIHDIPTDKKAGR